MLKKQTYIFQHLISIFFLFTITACSEADIRQNINCEDSPNKCLVLKNENIVISFDTDKLLVEQPYKVTIKSVKTIASIVLKPITMEMSEIHLYDQNSDKSKNTDFSSVVMFGICNDPEMSWSLTVLYNDDSFDSFSVNTFWPQRSS